MTTPDQSASQSLQPGQAAPDLEYVRRLAGHIDTLREINSLPAPRVFESASEELRALAAEIERLRPIAAGNWINADSVAHLARAFGLPLVDEAELARLRAAPVAVPEEPGARAGDGNSEPDFDAWQCDRCHGDGWHWTEEEGCEPRDKVAVKTHCEQCGGLGWLGPDAKAAATHAKEKTNV